MQIKNQLGKLNFKIPIAEMIAIQQQDNDLKILDINLQHINQLNILPLHHNDPFDRLLLSQSTIENMPLISADEKFKYYDNAKIIW
jgi:PIN domain nuclease of toxin-antitoxin system